MFWTPDRLAARARGRWLAPMSASAATGFAIDSRKIATGQVFIALRGEHADGHDFLHHAARAGASTALVERAPVDPPTGLGLLLVEDSIRALADLARAFRIEALDRVRIVGITGSSGKTTTVRLVDSILATCGHGSCPPGSFNNHLGVPLTLLAARERDDYLIVEIGTNAPGEIRALADLARPQAALITSIGRAHVQGLGGREGVAREKASLFDALVPPALRVLPGDEPLLAHVRPAITFGLRDDCDYRVESIACDASGTSFFLFERSGEATPELLRLPLVGRHNALNAAAAAALARAMGIAWDDIRRGLAEARGAPMRLEVKRLASGVEILDDSYNANPDSMLAALRTLRDLPARGRRVAMLGEMRELGVHANALHAEIVADLARAPLDLVVLVGPGFRAAADDLAPRFPGRVEWFEDSTEPNARLAAAHVREGDIVLVKGSRATRMERLASAIEAAALAARAGA